MTKVQLRKPIPAHGQEVTEIELREPTPADVMEEGVPTLLIPSADGTSVGVEIRTKVIGRYISRLGGIPLSSVKVMSLGDFTRAQGAVMSFFSDGDGESSGDSPTESSTSPISGG